MLQDNEVWDNLALNISRGTECTNDLHFILYASLLCLKCNLCFSLHTYMCNLPQKRSLPISDIQGILKKHRDYEK